MNIAIFAYSRTGCKTARRICMALPEAETLCYAVPRLAEPGFLPLEKAVYGAAFSEMDALIFVGAAGIAVREIAPYVRDKRTDPAVLGLDERANFVIPLLSGHIGGANALARRLAAALGATAVVTTATDVNGKFSVDTWAAEHGCAISDMGVAKQISAEILEHSVPVCSDFPIQGPLPDGLVLGESGELGIYVGYRCSAPFMHTLRLVPRVLRVGVGCRKGISREAVEAAIQTAFASHDLDLNAVKGVYSIDLKRQEAGLLARLRRAWLVRDILYSGRIAGCDGGVHRISLRAGGDRHRQRLRTGGDAGRGAASGSEVCGKRRDHCGLGGNMGGRLWVRYLSWASAPEMRKTGLFVPTGRWKRVM